MSMMTKKRSWMERLARSVTPAGVVMSFLLGGAGAALATGGEAPRAPASAQGRQQADPRPEPDTSGRPEMDEQRSAAPTLINGELRAMGADTRGGDPGAVQPPLSREMSAPRQGAGPQQGRKATAPSADRYLHLVLEVTEGDGVTVLAATELAGRPVFSESASGAYVYEVTSGGRTLAVESMADPFEIRSFPPRGIEPEHGGGHAFGRSRSATISVRVPGMSLQRAASEDIGFTLYRAKEQLTGRLAPDVLEQLKREGKVERAAGATGRTLSEGIARKGKPAMP